MDQGNCCLHSEALSLAHCKAPIQWIFTLAREVGGKRLLSLILPMRKPMPRMHREPTCE